MNALWLTVCTISALLGGAASKIHWPPRFKTPYSGRDVKESRTEAVFDEILETLKTARSGITSFELVLVANKLNNESDALAGEVSAQDVDSIIREIARSIGSSNAVTAIFDGHVNFDAQIINDALSIWEGLAKKGRELSDANKSTGHIMAAIRKTATAIALILKDIDTNLRYSQPKALNDGNTGGQSKNNFNSNGANKDQENNLVAADTIKKRGLLSCLICWVLDWIENQV